MIERMMTVRITEAEFASDVRAVLEKVQRGSEVIIEQEDHRPVAVISSPHRSGRPITDILRERNNATRLLRSTKTLVKTSKKSSAGTGKHGILFPGISARLQRR